jgi:S1-C subfamily serine protease
VRPRSLAAKAGLRDGDVLVSLNGTRLRNPGDFMAERSKVVASGQLQLGIQRGTRTLDIKLLVARRKKA